MSTHVRLEHHEPQAQHLPFHLHGKVGSILACSHREDCAGNKIAAPFEFCHRLMPSMAIPDCPLCQWRTPETRCDVQMPATMGTDSLSDVSSDSCTVLICLPLSRLHDNAYVIIESYAEQRISRCYREAGAIPKICLLATRVSSIVG